MGSICGIHICRNHFQDPRVTLGAIETKILGSEEINIEERTLITGYGGVNMSQGAKQY